MGVAIAEQKINGSPAGSIFALAPYRILGRRRNKICLGLSSIPTPTFICFVFFSVFLFSVFFFVSISMGPFHVHDRANRNGKYLISNNLNHGELSRLLP